MMSTKHNTFCRVCEPSCALIAEVENDEIVSLLPDRDHPVTKGFACHKGLATGQTKAGSTFLEADSEYQHITTAIGYCVDHMWPISAKRDFSKVVPQETKNFY